jgi:glycosyltransferase involved in cell wall biosynthesis
MRIAIDATPAAAQHAGVGRYTRELLRALVSLPGDDTFTLASAANGEQNAALLRGLPPGRLRELRRLPAGARIMTGAWQRLRLPVRAELLIGDFDVFHGPDFVVPPSRRPRVATLHDLSFVTAPELGEPRLVNYLRAAVPRTLRDADAVIAVSASIASEIAQAYPWVRERVVAIPNGVRPPSSTERRPADRPTLLTVGTIEPRKNLPALLDALPAVRARHPDVLLVIAGRIGWRADDIVRRIREAEHAGTARLVEAPSDAALDDLYATATLFVYPSLYEGFGLPLLEAIARGLPTVASDVPALVETGGEAVVYADPRSAEDIAAAVIRLLDDGDLRTSYAGRGARRAAAFTWVETARRTRRVYQHASEGGR